MGMKKDVQERILLVLDKENPLSKTAISHLIGRNIYHTRSFLEDLEKKNLVVRSSKGRYEYWRKK